MSQQTLPVAAAPAWPAEGAALPRPRLLALDLSLRSTGVAWTDHTGQIGAMSIRPATTGHERLNQILLEITRRAQRERVQLAIIEQPIIGDGSALGLAGLYTLVTHALWLRQIPYVAVHTSHLKMYALGKGGGPDVSKSAVVAAMQRLMYGHGPLIRDEDQADASALLCLGLHAYGAPPPVDNDPKLAAARLRAVRAVKWPALGSPVPGSVTRAPLPGAGGGESIDE